MSCVVPRLTRFSVIVASTMPLPVMDPGGTCTNPARPSPSGAYAASKNPSTAAPPYVTLEPVRSRSSPNAISGSVTGMFATRFTVAVPAEMLTL